MSEILLQAIVEKLEALEMALLKENETGKNDIIQKQLLVEIKSFRAEFIKLNSEISKSNQKINNISQRINSLGIVSDHSVKNKVQHVHHFHNQIWSTFSLFIISLLLSYCWINCHYTKKTFEANDIKYRYLKIQGNTNLLKITYYTDSLYGLDKNDFIKQVLRSEQEKTRRLTSEKKKTKGS